MVRLIPEKTVEIQTAFSLVNHLGPDTWIWSPAKGVDQRVGNANLRKFFMLELKAPEDSSNPYFEIDLAQLKKYRSKYNKGSKRSAPDVMYLLPKPPQDPSSYMAMKGALCDCRGCCCYSPRYWIRDWSYTCCNYGIFIAQSKTWSTSNLFSRMSFCTWSYVVRASDLAYLLPPKQKSARVRISDTTSSSASIQYHNNSRPVQAQTLCSFLEQVYNCTESPGVCLRSVDQLEPRTITDEEDGHEDIPLNPENIDIAFGDSDGELSSHLFFVGV